MHFVYCGFILRYYWPLGSDGCMCCWKIFICTGLCLFKLHHWHLLGSICYSLLALLGRLFPSVRFFNGMHIMYCGFILRDYWPLGGDGCMCCRSLFNFWVLCLFKLHNWHLLGSIGFSLYKLLGRLFPSVRFFNGMHIVYCGLVLCDFWSLGGDGGMRCRQIL